MSIISWQKSKCLSKSWIGSETERLGTNWRNNIFEELCRVSSLLQANTNDAVSMITSGSPRLTARPSHGKSLRLGPGSRCKS